jgi:hypothetical protein
MCVSERRYVSTANAAPSGPRQASGHYVRQRTYKARHVSVAYVHVVEDQSLQVYPGGHTTHSEAGAVAELRAGRVHVARAT